LPPCWPRRASLEADAVPELRFAFVLCLFAAYGVALAAASLTRDIRC